MEKGLYFCPSLQIAPSWAQHDITDYTTLLRNKEFFQSNFFSDMPFRLMNLQNVIQLDTITW